MINRNYKAKPVIAENIKTGEVLEFQSQYALARYFTDLYDIESSSKNIGRLVTQKKPYRKTWKVYFAKDMEVANAK
ncbi:MAG: hypothetical protein KH116_10750 [Clostridium sp.]|nr:hypothetical protein [Clostridium sp.]DAE51706.1 MAG TPA: hypothetical protein [Caudoviricetes sp.]